MDDGNSRPNPTVPTSFPKPYPRRLRRALASLPGAFLLLLLLSGGAGAASAQEAVVLGRVVPLPNTVVEIYSPADGRILPARANPVTVGDQVQKGDALAIIEYRYNLHDASHMGTVRWDLLSVMLEARRVALKARIDREKAERLFELGSISGQEVQAVKAAEQVAEGEYAKRKELLDYQDAQVRNTQLVRRGLFTTIDGEVSFANFTQGQLVTEGVLLYRVVNLKEVGFAARFPEGDRHPLNKNATVEIRLDAVPGKVYTGHFETVSAVIDPATRTRDVVFRVENPGELLRFEMIGRVEWEAP